VLLIVQNRLRCGFAHSGCASRFEFARLVLAAVRFARKTQFNFKSTTIGDNILVTCTISVAQTIDGKQLPPKPARGLNDLQE
jgi:hypothetical protein